MRDVIVVGARCAGAPTAMLLARKGHDVLLVDRSTFPSDIPHGHFIHRHGPRRLAKWGLLDSLVAAGCPPSTSWTFDQSEFPVIGRDLVMDGIAMGYGPRRSCLDKILVDAAVAAGAELRDGFTVDSYTSSDGQITGITGHERHSSKSTQERARITIGADGRHSHLAEAVGAEYRHSTPPLTCWYFSYWSGVSADGLELYRRGNRVIFAFPTNDQLFAIFVAWPRDEMHTVRTDIEGHFMAVIDTVPALSERVRAGQREEQYRGASDLPNYLRAAYGPGWALVGDAGCHKDPYMALGVCDAFRDAELLADAVDAGLTGRRPLEEALAEYEQVRNQMTEPEFFQNIQMAQFTPLPPDLLNILRVIHGDQKATNQFLMAVEGMIPEEEFFNPSNLGQLMERSQGRSSAVPRTPV